MEVLYEKSNKEIRCLDDLSDRLFRAIHSVDPSFRLAEGRAPRRNASRDRGKDGNGEGVGRGVCAPLGGIGVLAMEQRRVRGHGSGREDP